MSKAGGSARAQLCLVLARALDSMTSVVCNNARVTLSQDQDRRLFAESAGTCLLDSALLFVDGAGRSVNIAERAHVIAHSDIGPRADTGVSGAQRGDPENIVLLCPSCHTQADKLPEEYPADMLLGLKAARAAAVARVGGVPTFRSRVDARRAVESLLERNWVLFDQYGPDGEDGSLPSNEAATKWSRLVLNEITPGNDVITAIVDLHPHLTTPADRRAAELLRAHNNDLREKHSGRTIEAPAKRFPQEATNIFAECK